MKSLNNLKIGTRLKVLVGLAILTVISLLGIETYIVNKQVITKNTDVEVFSQIDQVLDLIHQYVNTGKNNADEAAILVNSLFSQPNGLDINKNVLVNYYDDNNEKKINYKTFQWEYNGKPFNN